MPRRNLAGNFWGESQRLTVRVSSRELRALDDLADAWGIDRSEAIRRAIREAATGVRRQRRQALLAALPTITVAQLRRVAGELDVPGRSRMTSPELRNAVRARLER